MSISNDTTCQVLRSRLDEILACLLHSEGGIGGELLQQESAIFKQRPPLLRGTKPFP